MADTTGETSTTRAERIAGERASRRSFVLPFVLGGASALAVAGGALALVGAFSGGGESPQGVSLAAGICVPDGGITGGAGTAGGGTGGGQTGGGTTPGGSDNPGGGNNPGGGDNPGGGNNPGGGPSVNPLDLITLNGQGGPLLWLNLTGNAPGVLGARTGTPLDQVVSGLDGQALTPVVGGLTSGVIGTGGSTGGGSTGGLGGLGGGLGGLGGGLGGLGGGLGGTGTGGSTGGTGGSTGGTGSSGSNIVGLNLTGSGSPIDLNLSGSATGVLGTTTGTGLDGAVSSANDQVLSPLVGTLTGGLLK